MSQTPDFQLPELTLALPSLGNITSDIRLLTLLPAHPSEHIRCTLCVTSIEAERLIYKALSYTWGDMSGQRVIECNGYRALVGRNHFSALSRLRDTRSPITLWTDALCINQSTTGEAITEREKQVQMMDKIYSRAELVYVDLGEDPPEIDLILQLLQKFDVVLAELRPGMDKTRKIFKSHILPSVEDPTWPHVVQFMRRPWFSRVWVMQEFILAKNVQVLVGSRRLDNKFLYWLMLASLYFMSRIDGIPSDFTTNLEFYKSHTRLSSQLGPGSRNLVLLLESRRLQQNGDVGDRDFSSLLSRSKTYEATDKRDRAYALLGLTEDLDSSKFTVNYKETVDEVGRRVSRYLLVESDMREWVGRGALYCSVGVHGTGPSWAYDLAGLVQSDVLLAQVTERGSSDVFQACLGHGKLDAFVSGPRLTVTGFVLGSISELTKPLLLADVVHGTFGRDMVNWILEAVRLAAHIQKHSSQCIDMPAFWTTAFAECYVKSWGKVERTDTYPEFDQQIEDFNASINLLQKHLGDVGKVEDLENQPDFLLPLLTKFGPVMSMIGSTALGRRLAYTSNGMMALVVGEAQAGDMLSIFHNTPLPFVLRKEQENFRLVGTCYIHDMMDGEVFESGKWKAQRIVLC